MGSGIHLRSVRGIAIKLHPSFLLALLWVVYHWGIAAGDGLRGAVFGLLLLAAVFLCVVGHELAHSFAALRYGLTVLDITLLPIGGVARIEHAPISPRREAVIALAGPIVNVLIAIGLAPFALGVWLDRDTHSLGTFVAVTQESGGGSLVMHLWLANIMLALFNLLPAFPMDGGRVLRAWLSLFSTRLTATRISMAFGCLLALALVAFGFYAHDYVLPLVAAFIVASAFAETRMIQVENSLRTLPVGQFALWDMGGVAPDAPLTYALRGGSRDVAVTEQGAVVGMLWRERVLELVRGSDDIRVRDVMDQNVVPMRVTDSVYDVHRRMIETKRHAIPIIEGNVYRGIFTSDRLVHVYRYLQLRNRRRQRYRELVEALGFVGIGR